MRWWRRWWRGCILSQLWWRRRRTHGVHWVFFWHESNGWGIIAVFIIFLDDPVGVPTIHDKKILCLFLIHWKWMTPRGQEMKQLWWSDKILGPYICKMRRNKIWITLTSFIVFYIFLSFMHIIVVHKNVSIKSRYIWWEIDKLYETAKIEDKV